MADEVVPQNKILTVVLNGLAFLAVGLSLTGWLNPPAGVALMIAAIVYWLWEILALGFTARHIASPFRRGLIGMGIFAIIAAACWSPIIKRLHSQEQGTTDASIGTQESKSAETKPQENTAKTGEDANKKAVKQKPKLEQHSQADNSPSINVEQKSSGPNSPNVAQIGNNNKTTITLPLSRIPSDKQVEDFKDTLRGISEPKVGITLFAAGSSDDVEPIKQKLGKALHELRWSWGTAQSVSGSSGPPLAEGIECYSTEWDKPDAETFLKAMEVAGLPCKKIAGKYPLDFSGGPRITVLIGRQPRQVTSRFALWQLDLTAKVQGAACFY